MKIKVKPFVNKTTKQISIVLPKKKMKIFNKGIPKKIKLNISKKDLEW